MPDEVRTLVHLIDQIDEAPDIFGVPDRVVAEFGSLVKGEGVEHGGHAVGDQLFFGFSQGQPKVHETAGSWGCHVLDVVGVDVDEARHQPSSLGIDHLLVG